MVNQSYQIVILGGGTAGIMSAALLLKKNANLKLAIIEPSYQPLKIIHNFAFNSSFCQGKTKLIYARRKD